MRKSTQLFMVLLVFFLLDGCVPQEKKKTQYALYWPDPPAAPSLVYKGIYRGEAGIASTAIGVIAGRVEIKKPFGISASVKGDLFVTDQFHKAVFKFDRTQKKTSIFGQGILRSPTGIAVRREMVYVADASLNEVLIFRKGRLTGRFGSGILRRPTGLAIDRSGRVYVASTFSHSIEVFSAEGEHLFGFGKKGMEEGMFFIPTDIEVREGKLYVVDSGNRRIQVFTLEGEFIKVFGRGLIPQDLLGRPKGIAIDSEGNLYVTDALKNRFYVFDGSGKLICRVGKKGRGRARFQVPGDVVVDRDDYVYVADQMNGRIQVFRHLKTD